MKTLTLTISQFNTFIKNILDAEEFLSNIAIIGEVTNLKVSNGNAFFDLKDQNAMISCVKFGAYDLTLKNGDMVTVYGKVNFYVKSGKVNFVVARVMAYGLGNLYQEFLKLKEKLENEGLFKDEIKKSIPKFAKRIGVVTSETGAVIRDIINVTKSKNPYTDLIVFPSRVQGVGAENEIVSGIKYFNTRDDIDTIIIARGGGSLEDLAPFNTEKIVRAIYDSKIPIISAVGHETDFTLCDFASDLRVPTPSVGAEVAVFDFYEKQEDLKRISERNSFYLESLLKRKSEMVNLTSNAVIDKMKFKVNENRSKVVILINEINNIIKNICQKKNTKLETLVNLLSKQNPLEILKNGYTVVEKNSSKVSLVKNLNLGDNINIVFQDGTALVKVIKIDEKGEENGI